MPAIRRRPTTPPNVVNRRTETPSLLTFSVPTRVPASIATPQPTTRPRRAPTTDAQPDNSSTTAVTNESEYKLVVMTRTDGDSATTTTTANGASSSRSVALANDILVVGMHQQDTSSTAIDSGGVYVYARSDDDNWTPQAVLTASDGRAQDFLGYSVAVSGTTIVVGAYQDDTATGFDSGSVYVYTRFQEDTQLDSYYWTEQAHLMADKDGGTDDRMGISVAIDNDTIVVGASGDDSFRGSVYVFVRTAVNDEDSSWTQQAKLTAGGGHAGRLRLGRGSAGGTAV